MGQFYLMTDDQREIVDLVDKFCKKELDPIVAEYDRKGEFPMHVYEKAGELGFWGIGIPAEYGGLDVSCVTHALVKMTMGYHDAGYAASHDGATLGIKPILESGSEDQKHYVADRILNNGEFTCMCITEGHCGSDVSGIKTTAVREGDEYVLNGTKAFVTNGSLASMYTVLAVTDKTKGYKGMSLFLVERDIPGVIVGKDEDKMGFRLSNTTEVSFVDVRVPVKNLIGQEGMGFTYIMQTLNRTRPMSIASAIGLSQRALDYAVEYSKIRFAMGQPIYKNQGISFMLADMEIQIEAARQLMLYNCEMIDRDIIMRGRGSIPKAFAADMCMKVTTNALQVFGGYGYTKDYPMEKLMRDAKIFSIFEGPTQIQLKIIAELLTGK